MKRILPVALSGAFTLASVAAESGNLLQNGSFEMPEVAARIPAADGGDPSKAEGANTWHSVEVKAPSEGGKFTMGLTNEIARTGKQSFFANFENLTATNVFGLLATKSLPIVPGKTYRTSIWCRVDFDRPIALDERRPSMWTDIEFFKADGKTAAGEAITSVKLIPGSTKPGQIGLTFATNRWSELTGAFTAPPDAAFMDITWSWTVPNEEGETDGVVYYDDAAVDLLPEELLLPTAPSTKPPEPVPSSGTAPR
jgi:hypothetical protein